MYLRGFAKLVEDASGNVYDDGLPEESVTWPSTSTPTRSADWIGVVSQAIRTWGDVTVAQERAETDRALAPYYVRAGQAPGSAAPLNRPLMRAPGANGAFLGLSFNTWIVLGTVLAAAVAIARR